MFSISTCAAKVKVVFTLVLAICCQWSGISKLYKSTCPKDTQPVGFADVAGHEIDEIPGIMGSKQEGTSFEVGICQQKSLSSHSASVVKF